MRRAVILTASGFQDEEYIYPYYRLIEAGYKVEVGTPKQQVVFGKFGNPAKPTISLSDLNVKDFDMVMLPGGFEAPDRLRIIPEVLSFVAEMDKAGKLVAAICHGPWILISAGVAKGRKMTGFWSIECDIKNSGAEYFHKAPVIIDGNLITSPHYDNNPEFMKAVCEWRSN